MFSIPSIGPFELGILSGGPCLAYSSLIIGLCILAFVISIRKNNEWK